MSKTLQTYLVAVLLLCFSFVNAQTSSKSIAIEYAYANVAADDPLGQMMFASKRFMVYADEAFVSLKVYSVPDKPQTMDGIVTELVKNLADGKTYTCFTIGDKKVKLESSAEEREGAIGRIFGNLVDTSFTFKPADTGGEAIAGQDCRRVDLVPSSEDMTGAVIFLSTAADFNNDVAKALPVYVINSNISGLCLGNDQPFGANTYKLRALKIDQENKVDYKTMLSEYKTVEKAEVNKIIKAYIGM